MRTLVCITLASLLNAGFVLAWSENKGPSIVQHIFAFADANSDGSLTAEEYVDAGLLSYGITFEEADADGDGRTSIAEYAALYHRHDHGGHDFES